MTGCAMGLAMGTTDVETVTGLDYFGARYFSGAQGRFTSPDPLQWEALQQGDEDQQNEFQRFLGDPQNLNKYAYARNNPLRFIDPTGLYFCNGTDRECADFEAALNIARGALNSNDLTQQQKGEIQAVLTFYGKAGDVNGVSVRFGRTVTGGAAEADTFTRGGKVMTMVTVDPGMFASSNVYGRALIGIHEGVHGLDSRPRGRNPSNAAEELATERHAYGVESFTAKGLSLLVPGFWDPTLPPGRAEATRKQGVESGAQRSLKVWCNAAPGRCR